MNHVNLKPVTQSDLSNPECFRLYANPGPYFDNGQPKSPEEVINLLTKSGIERFEKGDWMGFYNVYYQDKFIGQCGMTPEGEHCASTQIENTCEIGFILFPEYRGLGLGKLLIQKMLEFIQAHQEVKEITATAHTENTPSWKLLESINMQRIGTIHRYGSERYQYSLHLQ